MRSKDLKLKRYQKHAEERAANPTPQFQMSDTLKERVLKDAKEFGKYLKEQDERSKRFWKALK